MKDDITDQIRQIANEILRNKYTYNGRTEPFIVIAEYCLEQYNNTSTDRAVIDYVQER